MKRAAERTIHPLDFPARARTLLTGRALGVRQKPPPMKTRLIFLLTAALLTAAPAGAQSVRELWKQRFDSDVHDGDRPTAIAVDTAGNVAVTGTSYKADGGTRCYTAKYSSASGGLLWQKFYTGPAQRNDGANAVATDSAGNVIITGFTDSAFNGVGRPADFFAAKYAATDGKLLWARRHNGAGGNESAGTSVAVDHADNVIVTGYTSTAGAPEHSYTAKYAGTNGAILWTQRGPSDTHGTRVVLDGAGNAIVTGGGNYNNRFYTAKYAAAGGALLWERSYFGPLGYDVPIGVAVDPAGNVAVTGYSAYIDLPLGEDDGYFLYEIYTAKYAAADGALLWENRVNKNGDAIATGVVMDDVGNVVITGGVNRSFFTAKLAAADGTQLWHRRESGINYYGSATTGLALDSSGNAVICGSGYTLFGHGSSSYLVSHFYTAKYAASNGRVIWEKRVRKIDSSASQIVAGPGFVAITGSAYGSDPTGTDFLTVKYIDGPTPETGSADGITPARATLRGTVNSNGFPSFSIFEYSLDPTLAGAATTARDFVGRSTAAVPVDAALSDLYPNTTYYYRVVTTADSNTTRGAIRSFKTTLPNQDVTR